MKLLVAGTAVKDYIHTGDKNEVRPGGIYYSIKGLLSAASPDDELFLLTALSDETRHLFYPAFSSVNEKYIYTAPKIPVVHLHLFEAKERCEGYENITQRLDLSAIDSREHFDGILVNMITGFDLMPNDIKQLKSLTNGPLFMDLHTLSRGMDEMGRRMFRPVPEVEEWLSSVDILQVNDSELKTLSDDLSDADDEIIKKVLSLGVKYLIITRGERGSSLYWLHSGSVISHQEPAYGGKLAIPVGCGDIFGAVFFYSFIASEGNAIDSMQAASRAAGAKT